jgi:hypothetical protein
MFKVLFRQYADHAYLWTTIPPGTPFDEAMREQFDVLGAPSPGDPVRTRRASLQINGKVERKGELRLT